MKSCPGASDDERRAAPNDVISTTSLGTRLPWNQGMRIGFVRHCRDWTGWVWVELSVIQLSIARAETIFYRMVIKEGNERYLNLTQ